MNLEREIFIAIQLDTFKNIELFKQGLYQIRIRISYDLNNKIMFAIPEKIWTHNLKQNPKNSSFVHPAHILDQYNCFNSRVMLVRYQEETIHLQESCVFSCKISEDLRVFSVRVHTDLYFTNLENKAVEKSSLRSLNPSPDFRCVVNKEHLVTNIFNSLSHYLPISFDPKFFCSLDSIIHIYTTKYVKLDSSLKSFLFGDSSLVGGSKIDRAYYSLIDPLYMGYNYIRKLYHDCADTIIINKSDFPEKIILPIDDNQTKGTFHECLSTHDATEVTEKIILELEAMSEILIETIEKLLEFSLINSSKLIFLFKNKFHKEV